MDIISHILSKKYTDNALKENLFKDNEQLKTIVTEYLDDNPVSVDKTLSISGKASDAKATGDRLINVEYQSIVSPKGYKHINLPIGIKNATVDVGSDFGDKMYIYTDNDIIESKTFNKTFPYNGVTITRDGKIYHIEGTSTDDGSVYLGKDSSNFNFDIDKDISGKSFKLLNFANQKTNGSLSVVIRFLSSSNTVVPIINSNGVSKNQISDYIASSTLSRESSFTIPDNVDISKMQISISFKSGVQFNHDFQLYVVETDKLNLVTAENSELVINNNTSSICSFPYQSSVTTQTPIADYIRWMSEHNGGDSATYLTPEAFGAVGDGYTDDSTAIATCLAAASTSKQTVLMAKKYFVSAPIDVKYNGMQIIINDIVYNGNEAALKIRGSQNQINIHSISSNGVGVSFLGDASENVTHNSLEINSIVSKSHGLTFTTGSVGLYQNTVRFNYIKAGGNGCYGIAYFNPTGIGTFGEDNFYGGQISHCDWAAYGIRGNSKFYGIEIETEVRGGFYIEDSVSIFHPRISEAQRDGDLPIYKFKNTGGTTIYDSNGISINQIDLTEAIDSFSASGKEYPLTESTISKINGKIISKIPEVGSDAIGNIYCRDAYVWGKNIIMKPYMAYRKDVTTETLDTRLIGSEAETGYDIHNLAQLPTKFVVNTINSDIHLHASYCAFGFNEFEVEQTNGFACKIYDYLDNLIFDGSKNGDGNYLFKAYKDSTYCANNTFGLLRRDFKGQRWDIVKTENVSI